MATVTYPDKSFIAAFGPLKLEFVELTSVSNGDTFGSRLQNPQWAIAFNNGDASNACTISASVSGRTVTVYDPNITSVLVIVGGY